MPVHSLQAQANTPVRCSVVGSQQGSGHDAARSRKRSFSPRRRVRSGSRVATRVNHPARLGPYLKATSEVAAHRLRRPRESGVAVGGGMGAHLVKGVRKVRDQHLLRDREPCRRALQRCYLVHCVPQRRIRCDRVKVGLHAHRVGLHCFERLAMPREAPAQRGHPNRRLRPVSCSLPGPHRDGAGEMTRSPAQSGHQASRLSHRVTPAHGPAHGPSVRGRANGPRFPVPEQPRIARPWPERPVSAANMSGRHPISTRRALTRVRPLWSDSG